MAGKSSRVVVKLVAENDDLRRKLDQAKGQLENYKKHTDSVSKGVTASFKAIGGAVTAAVGVVKGMEEAIKSTQTTADAFANTMAAAKTSVEGFFGAIMQGNLSGFLGNLKEVTRAAMEAAGWMDQLGNTSMSYGYWSSRYQADFAEQMVFVRDKTLSNDERMAAKAKAEAIVDEMARAAETYRSVTMNSAFADVAAKSGGYLSAADITRADIEKILAIDVRPDYADVRSEYASQYGQFIAADKELRKMYTTWTTNAAGMAESTFDAAGYQGAVGLLKEKYHEALVFNALLEMMTDEQLAAFINKLNQADAAEKQVAQMAGTIIRYASSLSAGSTAPVEPAVRESLPLLAIPSAGAVKAPVMPVMPEMNTWTVQAEDTRATAEQATSALANLATAMGYLNQVTNGSSESWLAWTANVLQAVAQALPAIQALTVAQGAEATASGTATVGKAGEAAASGGPVAAIAAVLATAAAVAAAFASVPKFAEGGVIGGASFSGDNMLARVNSGEVILNRDQQAILAGNLAGGSVEFHIKDSELYGVLNNYNRRQSRL